MEIKEFFDTVNKFNGQHLVIIPDEMFDKAKNPPNPTAPICMSDPITIDKFCNGCRVYRNYTLKDIKKALNDLSGGWYERR